MNQIRAELAILCQIIQIKPKVLYLPMVWLIFCGLLLLFIGTLHIDPNSHFYPFVEQHLHKIQLKILIAGVLGDVILFYKVYRKEKQRLFF